MRGARGGRAGPAVGRRRSARAESCRGWVTPLGVRSFSREGRRQVSPRRVLEGARRGKESGEGGGCSRENGFGGYFVL